MALEVHVVTPEREVWSGQATEVIAHGVDGDVGILAGHAPLLVHLAIGPLQIQEEDGTWLKAVVDGGFLHVSTEEGASGWTCSQRTPSSRPRSTSTPSRASRRAALLRRR